jgi:ATP-dependent exoDNAse (exonuclease V) beta subunit
MRLLYVAATRAKDRLIFSAAVERKRLETLDKSELWVGWLWRALGLEQHSQTGIVDLPDDAQIHITINRDAPTDTESPVTPTIDSETTIDIPGSFSDTFPLLQPIASGAGSFLRRFTVTQLINFQRCTRQYYFERLLRTPGAEERAVWNEAEAPEPPANLTATLKGAVIHRFCETYGPGDDPEVRLRTSFAEVKALRQSELAGRVFDIDDDEAVRTLLPLAQNYLASDVFQRVSRMQRVDGDPQSAIRNPQSPGLWSELRFRLRRPLGILTGTIDKLLIAPADGAEVDVEIIDFKTNRFPSPKSAPKNVRSATAQATAVIQSGQASFDFDAPTETSPTFAASLDEQAQAIARDYQLQMQAYALALRELLPAGTRVRTLRATLHFLDPNIEISLPADLLSSESCAAAIDGATQTIAAIDGTLNAELFPPLAATHCRTCNFLELCPAGRNRLQSA